MIMNTQKERREVRRERSGMSVGRLRVEYLNIYRTPLFILVYFILFCIFI
jgi:hypothetical protein